MKVKWKDIAHLARPTIVFVAGIGVFLLMRGLLVPPSFGQYGHYRGAVLEEIGRRPLKFAGQDACAACHPDQVEARAAGNHKSISCEACHGPAAVHVEDPMKTKPTVADIAALCSRCHEADGAKPAWFKQVVTKEHYEGALCSTCHQPHRPKM